MKIFISAGEQSGDIHAAKLMDSLKKREAHIEFIGFGGEMMTRQGLKPLADINEMSVVGFWEVAKKFNYFLGLLNKVEEIFKSFKFDAVILVDYPGFNIKIAKLAKKYNFKVVYYIAPQLWAWGEKRARILTDYVDLLLCVFPFEVEFFKKFDLNVKFVGHPLLDEKIFQDRVLSYDERENYLALMPGSRNQELKKHLSIFEKISINFIEKNPDFKVAISLPSNINRDSIKNFLTDYTLFNDSREMLKISKIGLIKSGTSTLEAALLGLPFIMVYKTSFLTYWYGKKIVNLPYLSLPNILSKNFLIEEFIQNIDYKLISSKLSQIISSRKEYDKLQENLLKIKLNLGNSGASNNVSNEIIKFLQ